MASTASSAHSRARKPEPSSSAGRIWFGLSKRPPLKHPVAATIGVFDGVHVAHQKLIRLTVQEAQRLRGSAVAVTFDPDPQHVLRPDDAHPALMPVEERCRLILSLGVDAVVVIRFTRAFARIPAQDFIRRVLERALRVRELTVGSDFSFGHGAQGNVRLLREWADRSDVKLHVVAPLERQGKPVSSSRIRRLIEEGNLSQARRLLGRAPLLYGTVIPGQGRGRVLGVPTANLALIPQVLPPNGVYGVRARYDGREWCGVMNLGRRPTFGYGPVVCEVHLFDFSEDIYGKPLSVSLAARLRSERCFASIDALKKQIQQDIRRARRLLAKPSA